MFSQSRLAGNETGTALLPVRILKLRYYGLAASHCITLTPPYRYTGHGDITPLLCLAAACRPMFSRQAECRRGWRQLSGTAIYSAGCRLPPPVSGSG